MTIIAFTNSTGINSFNLGSIDNFATNDQHIAVVYADGTKMLVNTNNELPNGFSTQNMAVILVSDTQQVNTNDNTGWNIGGILLKLLTGSNDLYIIYHDNVGVSHVTSHKQPLQTIFNERIKGELASHHIADSTFHKFFTAILPDFSQEKFDNLKPLFPDPVLEAKLELLHKCMAFEENSLVLPPLLAVYREQFEKFINNRWNKKLTDTTLIEDENEKRRLDADNEIYKEALTDFRIALLGE